MFKFYRNLFVIFILPFLITISHTYAATVIVKVNNIEKQGEMHLAIYDDAEVFENDDGEKGGAAKGIIQGVIEDVETGSVTYTFELQDGTYAIGIFVDKNYNNKMDRNLFGVPKEQFGFSNNAKGNFGPPSFEDASFTVSNDMKLEINL
ncbi:DUF2141 domain-containing protein [Candidatus Pelagibacter sp.]|uniref:DUF2141 domain-containing protein n=1 Tax=Candidatus Pelagibacter sp. TaxID=2024849 RepID=UPI003F84AC0F